MKKAAEWLGGQVVCEPTVRQAAHFSSGRKRDVRRLDAAANEDDLMTVQ